MIIYPPCGKPMTPIPIVAVGAKTRVTHHYMWGFGQWVVSVWPTHRTYRAKRTS